MDWAKRDVLFNIYSTAALDSRIEGVVIQKSFYN